MESTASSVDYRRGILSELSSILEAAVDDKRLARNPMQLHPAEGEEDPYRRRALSVAEEMQRHVEAFSPVEVGLPWGKPDAEG
ncbi:hypothetical protein GCM10010377_04200 [Streptomyces viridiviolaceus]|uniref:Uncharacterized protein n=1 Tax=Streptomyces viridiviolaceus TaxID=68282 RepID=A0ABW2DW64_9ACTN|nr:hypothetical protein [Streptomyces viridiviolaceus]GHB17459.1 hypothetical protein GCM10010377_04200 [Streptomyces viridiviolaceus]